MAVVLLFVLIIVAVVTRMYRFRTKAWIGMKTSRLILVGYGVLLLLLTVASLLLPINGTSFKAMSEEEIKESMNLQNEVLQDAYRGSFSSEQGIHEVKSWTFPLTSEELVIRPISANAPVLVEKRSDLGSEIEVTHYVGKTIVNGFDISDQRPALNLDLNGNELRIKNAYEATVKMAELTHGFSFKQFKGEHVELFNHSSSGNIGMDFLYIKAPEGLKIEGNALYID